jgi:hypothetical protein
MPTINIEETKINFNDYKSNTNLTPISAKPYTKVTLCEVQK